MSSESNGLRTFSYSAILALILILPMAATLGWYCYIGHLPELWQALVTSNFERLYVGTQERILRFFIMPSLLGLPLFFAITGWISLTGEQRRDPKALFIAVWGIVAIGSVASFPNIIYHYAIPNLPPLCILSAIFFAWPKIGWVGYVVVLTMSLFYDNILNLTTRFHAHQASPNLVDYVQSETPNKNLLVMSIPNYLYALIGATPANGLAISAALI